MTILFFAPTFAPCVVCHFTQDSPGLAILSPNKMTVQMKSIQFSLVHTYDRKKQTDKNGEGLIWVVAYQAGKHKYYSTGVRVRPDQWSRKRACILRHPNAAAYNAKLNAKVAELANYQVQLINSKFGDHIRLAEFDEKYRNSEAGTLTFTSFYESELERCDLVGSSRQAQRNTLNKLKAVKSVIHFNELTYNVVDKFHKALVDGKLSQTTIAKHHKDLKKYIHLAIKKDLLDINANPYKKFEYSRGRSKPKDFLRIEEIELIEQLNTNSLPEPIRLIKNFFLLTLYTGLRFSDAVTMTPGHLGQTHKGLVYNAVMQKTRRFNKKISLPLYALFKFSGEKESRAQRIVKRCLMLYRSDQATPLFKGLSNPVANRNLKELAYYAGINKHLTCHTARHSFGTNMAVKVPISTLQYYMGHDKVSTTSQYIQWSREIQDRVMEQIEWESTV